MNILGVWDGHDSGAAIVSGGKIISAVNEEKFSRRKLEVRFPINSILFCLKANNLTPKDIAHVAVASSDFSMSLTRAFPKVKEDYYCVRRKIKKPNPLSSLNRPILNNLGKLRSNHLFRSVSRHFIKKNLVKLGFSESVKIYIVDHHAAHAASAFFCSGKKEAITITLDALGDGISSTVNICEGSSIKRASFSKTKDSLGMLFQEAVQLLGMRILEDEGKVMCLADYSKKQDSSPLSNLYTIKNLSIKSNKSMEARWKLMGKLAGSFSKEDFSFMVQETLSSTLANLVSDSIKELSIPNICLAGGVFSNVKSNKVIRNVPGVENVFVFPHMGDGGLSSGAALHVYSKLVGLKPYKIEDVYLGPKFSEEVVLNSIKKFPKFSYESINSPSKLGAELLESGKIIYWFQGKTEYGPRALGNRSILARPDIKDNRRRLNLVIKRRERYQPFCPSILETDAKRYLSDYDSENRFMTMAHSVSENYKNNLSAVMSVDGTARPQTVGGYNQEFNNLIKNFKKSSGIGALLNTSFNIHGEPMVSSPNDALDTLSRTDVNDLIMGNIWVRKK